MRNLLSMMMVLALVTGVVMAQGQGGGPGGGAPGGMGNGRMGGGMMGAFGGNNTTMVKTDKDLFVLRGGVLAEFDLTSLLKVQELQLFGPAPERPADFSDPVATQKYVTDMMRRMTPGVLLVKGDSLLLVIGDNFARISQATLKVEASASLVAPGGSSTDQAAGPQMEGAPGYLLTDNTLYLMRSKEILSIDVTNGKIQARSILPKELQPAQGGMGMGGGRGFGGGAGRSNRGGGNRGGGAGQDQGQNPPDN